MRRALYIGRFQPFHKGHLSVIEQIKKDPSIDEIIILIGSSESPVSFSNPFTAEERKQMLQESLSPEKPVLFYALPDLHDDQKWMESILKNCPEFQVVFTGNVWVKRLMDRWGIKSQTPEIVHDFHATDIRLMIKDSNKKWEELVPEPVIKVIKALKGEDRIKELFTTSNNTL